MSRDFLRAALALTDPAQRVAIGMVHLRALPGSPGYAGDLANVREAALRDAEALAEGGVQAVMLENFGDVPFFPGRVPAETVAQMTAIAAEVKRRVALPLGINVLRNDGLSALAVAHAAGAAFIRVNVLAGARLADQGILHGMAHDLLRLRAQLGAQVRIMADVDVKHSAPLAHRDLSDEVDDLLHRALADALIVSGAGTGKATSAEKVHAVRAAAGKSAAIFVGSGVSVDNLREYAGAADGFIVGTALKEGGRVDEPVSVERVKRFVEAMGEFGREQ